MRPPLLTVALAGMLAGACADRGTGAEADARKAGIVRFDDATTKVGPMVLHDGRLDLFAHCRAKFETSKAAGGATPLCYSADKRTPADVKTIRVERRDGRLGQTVRRLEARDEATHFVVEHSAAIQQVLDLAWAPRRDGAYQAGEIRIITLVDGGHKPLVTALTALFPTAEVTESPLAPWPALPKPAPDKEKTP